MKDWDKLETIVVLVLLCTAVVFTYLQPVEIKPLVYEVDNMEEQWLSH